MLRVLCLLLVTVSASAAAEPTRVPESLMHLPTLTTPVPLSVNAPAATPEGWRRHDLWNGATTAFPAATSSTVAHAPYAPASRLPDTTTMRIVGTDDLQAVTATTTYPYSAIVKLFVAFPAGAQGGCSGTMVSPSTMLTAAHCVYSAQYGG